MFPKRYYKIPTTFQKVRSMYLQCFYNSPSTLCIPLQLLVVADKETKKLKTLTDLFTILCSPPHCLLFPVPSLQL